LDLGPVFWTYVVEEALSRNILLYHIVETGLWEGLEQSGAKYESGGYFLTELLLGLSTIEGIMEILRPKVEQEA
jgi:methanogenic corrinoid protein MtbC1